MQFTLPEILLIALLAVGIVAVITLIRALSRLTEFAESATATADEARKTVTEVREAIVPTLVKVDVAADGVNANLLRLDSILGDIEATTEQVAGASVAVNSLVNAPVDVVSTLAERLRKFWRVRRAEVTEDFSRYAAEFAESGHLEYAPVGNPDEATAAPEADAPEA